VIEHPPIDLGDLASEQGVLLFHDDFVMLRDAIRWFFLCRKKTHLWERPLLTLFSAVSFHPTLIPSTAPPSATWIFPLSRSQLPPRAKTGNTHYYLYPFPRASLSGSASGERSFSAPRQPPKTASPPSLSLSFFRRLARCAEIGPRLNR